MRSATAHTRWLVVVVLSVVALVGGPAGATGPTTITFSEHPAGTVIDTEYASHGVRFGKASDVGAPALAGAWDCGAPQVKQLTSDGPPPMVAQAPLCGGRSGTVVAFANPRKSIRLVVAATPSTTRTAQVLAYNRAGVLVAQGAAAATFQAVTIERPSPDVAFLAVQLSGEGTSAMLFDDLQFDHLGDPLTLEQRGVGATVGVERTDNVARLTDADPTATAADYTVTIEWGDGQSSAGRLVASAGGYDVVGTHTYASTGTFTLRTTVTKVNGVTATTTSTARVVDRPDFVVEVKPPAARVSQGATGRFSVSVTPLAGFTGTVSLSLSGAPGTTASFAPATVTVPGSSVLTVTTRITTDTRTYPLTVTATGAGLSRSATVPLTVTKASLQEVIASLDGPRAGTVSSPVTFDARRTTGAARFLWDLDGDRRVDVECGKGTPVLVARLRTPGLRTVSLIAVAGSGKTSVVRRTLDLGKGRVAPRGRRLPEVARCLRDPRNRTSLACTRVFRETVVFGLVEASGCFTHAKRREDVPARERRAFDEYDGDPASADLLVAHGSVMVNGLRFTPHSGASIVVFPQIRRIVSSRAEIHLGAIRVQKAEAVNLILPDAKALGRTTARARLLEFDPTGTPLTQQLGGFRLTGMAEVFLVRRRGRRTSETKVALALPDEMRLFGGERASGPTTLAADNDTVDGLQLDELRVVVPEANLGAVRLTNVTFEYKARGNQDFNCPRKWWKATANVFLGPTSTSGGFLLAPGDPRNGVAFCNGSFHSAGGKVLFNPPLPRPQLFPGVELKSLGFAFQREPAIVVGTASLSVARVTGVDMGLLVAFPTPSAPYRVGKDDAEGTLGKLVGRTFVGPTFAVGGKFSLSVSSLTIPFGNAYLAYSAPDYIALGGGAQFIFPGGTIKAAIDGEMRVSQALFSLHGSAEFCFVALVCPIVGVEAWVTSTGFVVCGTIAGELHPGVGYRWNNVWPEVWLVDGCKPSPYWVNAGPPDGLSLAPFASAVTSSFTVARGERSKNVRLVGVGGAPRVEVRGPDGEVVSTAQGDLARGRTINVLRQDAGRVTWIGVAPAREGRYTVTTLPGSVAIASVAETRPVDEHIRATVARDGNARLLRYDVARVSGRQVTFFERGRASYRRIGTVSGGRGVLRYVAAPGASGLQQIVVRAELRGVPTPDRVLTHYRIEPPKPLPRPLALRVLRTGGTVSLDWDAVGGATGYAVITTLGSGVQRVTRVYGGQTALRLAAIPVTEPGTVTVRALGPLGAFGPAARAGFQATRRELSPFRPFAELGRRVAVFT